MMVRSILVAIALVACVRAVPTPNDIVPETKFVEGAATSAHASAKQIVTEMIQAGSDWTACSELANATRDEVEDDIKTKQDMLDELDKGCGCAALGQDEVTRTVNEMNAAFNAVTDAETALETATNAQVQLADQEFQFLQAGECGWIMTDSSYQTAHVTYTTAVTTLATARTTYTLSVTAHTEAVTEAARLKLECECATQSAHAVAWADANQDNDANAAAWAQAHHIDCVVDHIAEADCSFGPAPGLTQPTLCDDIESVSCAAESGSAQHVPADEEPVYIDPCPLGMPNCGEQEAIATPTEGRTGSNGEQCFTYSCPPPISPLPVEPVTQPVDPCPLGHPYCGEQEAIATPIEGRTGSNGEQCFTYSCPPPPTVVSESAFDLGTEAWPAGFCMSNAIDQNNGVTKLEGGNYEGNTKEAQCLAQCKEHSADWTGCEVIWDQGNAGCYVHTEHVNYANNVDKHKCLLREVYDAAVPTTAEQTGCALNECRPGGSYTGTYSFTDFIGDPSGCTTTYCDQYLLGGQFHSRCTAAAGTDARGYADAECLGTCQGLCISNTDVDTEAVMPPPSPPSI